MIGKAGNEKAGSGKAQGETPVPLGVAQLQERLAHSTFIDFMGPEVLSADPAAKTVVMRLPMRPEFKCGKGSGQWHGGPLAAAIDTVVGYALVMLLGGPLPTINFRVDYLRPAVNTALTVTAWVRRNGRTVGVVGVDVANGTGAVVAIGRAACATAG